MSQLFTSGGQSIGVLVSASFLPMNVQGWFPLGWTSWISLHSKGLSRVFSNTTVKKHQFFSAQLSLLYISHIHTWLLEKANIFTLLFHFHQGFFSSSSLSAIRVVSSAYLRLLIFLLAVLIPDCASSSPAILMMYSAYKLNKQGDNIQPSCTPFPIWNQSVVPCPVLTVASWCAYRFLRRQERWSGIPISFRMFHSLLWSTQSKALA